MKFSFKRKNNKSFKHSFYLYGGIFIGFIVWMIFVDTHSWIIHSELNDEFDELESEKKALKQIIKKDKKIIKQLKNIDSLERFAREEYGHKKENESIFIIEMNDSLTN